MKNLNIYLTTIVLIGLILVGFEKYGHIVTNPISDVTKTVSQLTSSLVYEVTTPEVVKKAKIAKEKAEAKSQEEFFKCFHDENCKYRLDLNAPISTKENETTALDRLLIENKPKNHE